MTLGRQISDFCTLGLRTISAFGILPVAFIIPHFDAIPGIWKPMVSALRRRLKEDEIMIGIDEDTAIVGKLTGSWTVMGKAQAHVFTKGVGLVYRAGETFTMGK